ncbi:3-phosphoshikimate 1-carboxyvinyltransferase [Sulfoacidibacillus ferrooxidans]|uniref:3-phosphoshikimate 1-carboxyvinyltransferase n=1 Tax=Sulfoacidibacillus ferrooxidans TaxID=2005001 RepID=A0A9X1V896_9BACL|nr:3-phosphoshikimate 1-carboxyvinyltransferase [Sulfoacidibacillus ferrooxidans]MCI0182749.1 3-phosphoshikimate 1-carboxyvinyltransferase [Sulfoacidibacillus ferrooxidans]
MSSGFETTVYEVPMCLAPIVASVRVPGSKSITNRALPMAALANGTTRLRGALFSDDSRYFIQSLRRLGYQVDTDEEAKEVVVYGAGINPLHHTHGLDLFIGNSGTSARFLSAFVSLGEGRYRIDGVQRMRERPIAALLTALRGLHVRIDDELGTGCPPILIEANGITGGTVEMSGKDSSQFVSGLLLAAPYAKTAVSIVVQGELVSAPYVEMTLAMMRQFGVEVNQVGHVFHVSPGNYIAQDYAIEPDASGASYFLAAAAISGGTVKIVGLSKQSLQGDTHFVQVLANMGCRIDYGQDWIELSGPKEGLTGIDVDLFDMSDMVPTLAAIAPFAHGKVRIRNVANIRMKETDRIRACVTELHRLGVTVVEFDDGLEIEPCERLREGVTIHTYDDHRMAMAFAITGLRVPGTRIENPGCTAKTYPEFFSQLESVINQSKKISTSVK